MLHPTAYNTSQICYELGVKYAVMSPGSRNAPLTVSFARQQEIVKKIIPDERTAGFIALGIAQQTQTPVVLCCTSGSALLNYAPAIAEAYYREIPLIVLSADRPPELIDQRDGQTIRQIGALDNHVKGTWGLPVLDSPEEDRIYENQLIDAIHTSQTLPKGPVHINIPFREPFYPTSDQKLSFVGQDWNVRKQSPIKPKHIDISEYPNILVLIGQLDSDETLQRVTTHLADQVPVLRSPLNNLSHGISFTDAFLNDQQNLRPNLLITAGLSVLSKKTKNWIRKHKPDKHLHIDPAGVAVDTFQTHPELILAGVSEQLQAWSFDHASASYLNKWQAFEGVAGSAIEDKMSAAIFSESAVAFQILYQLPERSVLHLSNSMPVRYADLFGVKKHIQVYANRGTSGIDGCTSTMVGSALVDDRMHVLLTGDLAFLYDRNAFFHNYTLPNVRIIILNNQGGGIFRLINGPAKLPELEDYFETRHQRTAEYICAENKLAYHPVSSTQELNDCLSDFFEPGNQGKVLEVFTDPETNQQQYKELKNYIHERINDKVDPGR